MKKLMQTIWYRLFKQHKELVHADKLNSQWVEWEKDVVLMSEFIISEERNKRGDARLPSRTELAAHLCVRRPREIADYYGMDNRFLIDKIEERCVELLTGSTPKPVNNHMEDE